MEVLFAGPGFAALVESAKRRVAATWTAIVAIPTGVTNLCTLVLRSWPTTFRYLAILLIPVLPSMVCARPRPQPWFAYRAFAIRTTSAAMPMATAFARRQPALGLADPEAVV